MVNQLTAVVMRPTDIISIVNTNSTVTASEVTKPDSPNSGQKGDKVVSWWRWAFTVRMCVITSFV